MSYFQLSHPNQECSECTLCPASRYHREQCAKKMYDEDDRRYENYLIEQEILGEENEQ